MRLAAGSVRLIGRHGRVAIDELDALERDAQLLGDQLHLRGGDSLAEFFLAAVCGDASVGGDGDPGVDLIEQMANPAMALRLERGAVCLDALKPTISAPEVFKKSRRENPACFRAARASRVIGRSPERSAGWPRASGH